MKKVLSVLMIFVMLFSVLSLSVSAAETEISDTGANVELSDTAAQLDELATSGSTRLLAAPKLYFTYLPGAIKISASDEPMSSRWNFRFYIGNSRNGPWVRLKETPNNYMKLNIPSNGGGETYYFTVRIVSVPLLGGHFLTNYKGQSVYYCNTPGSLEAEQMSRGIRVSWDACYGVSKYRVYWRNTQGQWVREADVSGTSYTDTNPKKDWTNVYTVRGLDSDGDWCTGFKSKGCSCFQGGPYTTDFFMDTLLKGVDSRDGNVVKPNQYWSYSGIPWGCNWCTGFCNFVIGRSCGAWRFGGEWHRGAYWNGAYEEGEVYRYDGEGNKQWNYNNPADWHPNADKWAWWAYVDDIFYQPTQIIPKKGDIIFFVPRGDRDTFDNITHVGIVVSANGTKIETVEGNTGDDDASDARVNRYTYTWSHSTGHYQNSDRFVSGYIRMADIYNRTIYK